MIFVRLIDEQGLFLEDAFVETLTEFTIQEPCPEGFYHPKWENGEWVEGKTQEEIDTILASVVVEPTLDERVDGVEADVNEITDVLFGGA